MSALHRWSPSLRTWKRPLAITGTVTLPYSTSVFVYSVLPFSNVSISGTLWHALALSTAFGLALIGIPVCLRTAIRDNTGSRTEGEKLSTAVEDRGHDGLQLALVFIVRMF